MITIYQITNMQNGKYYIGSTNAYERRIWQHRHALRNGTHKNPHLQASWNKHGEDAFIFEIIEQLPPDADQLLVEDMYLAQHVGKRECYNINTGAEAPRLGILHTAATKEQIRQSKLANPTRAWLGKTRPEITKAKISAAQKGRPNTRKGTPMSEQGRANVAAAVKRGVESHFYGKRPANAEALQRPILAHTTAGDTQEFSGLSSMRDTLGVSIATIIRACKSGKPISRGQCAGWLVYYTDAAPPVSPTIPPEYANYPRTRALAKAAGATHYFTGIPCEKGHISPRKTKGVCTECLKPAKPKESA